MPTPHPSRSTVRRGVILASLVALTAACGGGQDVARDRFSSDLRARTTIPQDVADCLTDAIYEEFDQTEINQIYRAATEDELEDSTRETLDGFNRTCFEAEIARQSSTTGEAPTEGRSTTTADASSTTAPG